MTTKKTEILIPSTGIQFYYYTVITDSTFNYLTLMAQVSKKMWHDTVCRDLQ